MKEFFKRRGLLLFIIAIVICAVTIGSLYASGNRSSFITNTVNTVTLPLKKGIKAGVDRLESIYGYIYKYDTLEQENAQLKEENAILRAGASEAERIASDNEEYKRMLGLSETIRELKKVDAAVTGWTSSNWSSSFTIGKGSNDGIEVGDPVINSGGELVGQVSEVGTSWSVVLSIVDTSISIGANSGGTLAIASGDFELMRDGKLKLTNVPSTAQLVTGDTVYTSGAGEVFPPDLVIGTIASVNKAASGLTNYAIIEPSADLGTLSLAFVIIDYNYSG